MDTPEAVAVLTLRKQVAIASYVLAFLTAPTLAIGTPASQREGQLEQTVANVLPAAGYQSKVALGDSIIKLIHQGVLEPKKIEAVYAQRGSTPEELKNIYSGISHHPMRLTQKNASVYVTLLWALGLANQMSINEPSPLNGPSRFRFASTGGWRLGKEANGGVYFNKFPIVTLTATQEALVNRVARNTFRPCCNNSTFFQDCNHGSALLGLLTLGAAQGLGEDELYREALSFNAFWFPHNYIHTALYFKVIRGTEWRDVNARELMSEDFSSAQGWQANVARELEARGLLPQQSEADCNV